MNSFIPLAVGPEDAEINLSPYIPLMVVVGIVIFLLTIKHLRISGSLMLVGGLIVGTVAFLRVFLGGPEIYSHDDMINGVDGLTGNTGVYSQFDDYTNVGVAIFVVGFVWRLLVAIVVVGRLFFVAADRSPRAFWHLLAPSVFQVLGLPVSKLQEVRAEAVERMAKGGTHLQPTPSSQSKSLQR